MTSIAICIPARLGSQRFPAKPLADIDGLPLIQRATSIALGAALATEGVHVLSDSQQVLEAAGNAWDPIERRLCTQPYANGTERVADYAQQRWPDSTLVVVYQGDEVTIDSRDLDLAAAIAEPHLLTTLASRIDPDRNPTRHDVFCRLVERPIGMVVEYARGDARLGAQHVGVYVATVRMLRRYLKAGPCAAEQIDHLEQFRWDSMGVCQRAIMLPRWTHSVNVPEDVELVRRLL